MARWRDDYFPYFPPSRPREAVGGIKARSKRGSFGESWWAKRWLSVLEGFSIGARLGRGRSYARSGQVLSVDIDKGKVSALVQGSRPKPYAVTVQVAALSENQWKKLAGVLSKEAIFAAKLLAGEMPQDIERAFGNAGLSLFPTRRGDLKTDCSCPDWSNPCKHVAAVYYLLGEEFDRDPFLIFKLRGLDREGLTALVGDARPEGSLSPALPESEPLSADPAAFWGRILPAIAGPPPASAPPLSAALLRRLGGFSFWRGEVSILEALEPVYRVATSRGMEVVVGERRTGREGRSRKRE